MIDFNILFITNIAIMTITINKHQSFSDASIINLLLSSTFSAATSI